MNRKIREMQEKVLQVFSNEPGSFALSGGTALEVYYLHHRFSKDLDFFSQTFDIKNIESIISSIEKTTGTKIKLENELQLNTKAKMRVYMMPVQGSNDYLKIDFVEDVINKNPKINRFNNVPVYSIDELYLGKIITLIGTNVGIASTGNEFATGRNEVRDIIDVYYLSRKIKLLHLYLENIRGDYKRRMVQWYRTYSRQDFILSFLDYEVYDKELSSRDIITHLDNEIEELVKEEIQ